MPTFIDLTERRRDENTSAASSNGSGSSSPPPPPAQVVSKGRTRPLPKHYVCKRCKTPGHHITQCPTLRDKKYDSKPSPDYSCHACGMKGDHFIHSCPKKLPKGLLKKKKSAMRNQSEGPSPDSDPNPSPSGSRMNLGSTPRQEPGGAAKSRGRNKQSSGHVRKRSDDVEIVSESRKRFKPESIENYNPVVLEDSPPQLRSKELPVRTRPLRKGRLSPWDTERNDADTGIEPPPFMVDTVGLKPNDSTERQGSRAQRIAELETTSFLAELELEIGDEQVHGVLTTQPQFPSLDKLLADFDVPPQLIPTDSPSEKTQVSGDFDPNYESNSPGVENCRDVLMANSVDDATTPTPPRTPPIIEPYVTLKSLSASEYGAQTLTLFEHTPNFWVRKHTRNTALDMWATPDRDEQQETRVDQTEREDVREEASASVSH